MPSSSSWGRRVEKVRSVIGNSMGGLSGRVNLASWAVAGTLAYFLWIRPSQQLKKEQEERAALAAAAAASDPYRYIEKRKPIPDPQTWIKRASSWDVPQTFGGSSSACA